MKKATKQKSKFNKLLKKTHDFAKARKLKPEDIEQAIKEKRKL